MKDSFERKTRKLGEVAMTKAPPRDPDGRHSGGIPAELLGTIFDGAVLPLLLQYLLPNFNIHSLTSVSLAECCSISHGH